MKTHSLSANWGLKLLALILAIVIYHSLKTDRTENAQSGSTHDKRIFQWR